MAMTEDNKFSFGNLHVTAVYFGNQKVSKISLGNIDVYNSDEPAPPTPTYDYSITVTTDGNITSSGPSGIDTDGTATITLTANSGYLLPATITVKGATYTYDKATGVIELSTPTGDVTITANGVAYKLDKPVINSFDFAEYGWRKGKSVSIMNRNQDTIYLDVYVNGNFYSTKTYPGGTGFIEVPIVGEILNDTGSVQINVRARADGRGDSDMSDDYIFTAEFLNSGTYTTPTLSSSDLGNANVVLTNRGFVVVPRDSSKYPILLEDVPSTHEYEEHVKFGLVMFISGGKTDFRGQVTTVKKQNATVQSGVTISSFSSSAVNSPKLYNDSEPGHNDTGNQVRVYIEQNDVASASVTFTVTKNGTWWKEFDTRSSCLYPTTKILMSDGTEKEVSKIKAGDNVICYDHESGKFISTPITFNDHDELRKQSVLSLNFSNDTTVKTIYEHGFFDLDLNKYVYIHDTDYEQYIGHRFAILKDHRIEETVLVSGSVSIEETECFSPASYYHINYIVDGMLSMPGGIAGLFNIFEYDDKLTYIIDDKKPMDYNAFCNRYFDIIPEVFDMFPCKWFAYTGMTKEYIHYLYSRYLPIISSSNF